MHVHWMEVNVKTLSWVNFVLGLWLIAAAFVLSAGHAAVMTEEIVLGIIIAVLAYTSTIASASRVVAWAVAIAGLWTLAAPAMFDYGAMTLSKTNDIVVGIIVLVLGFANAVFRESPVRTHS